MVWPLVVVGAAALVGFLQRRNIAQLNHGIGTALSWQERENELDDCISQLPDEILANILSLLTVKEAVRTSILSRRWRHLSEYLPAINLNWFVMSGAPDRRDLNAHVCDACGGYPHLFLGHEPKVCARYFRSFRSNCQQFMDTCKNQKLLSFELSACVAGYQYWRDIINWINFALNKDLDKLSLQFYCVDYHDLDDTRWCVIIQTSRFSGLSKLKQLRLHSTILEFDCKPMFTSLVTLHLSYVMFKRNNVQCILSACSNLEEVRFEVCSLPSKLFVGDNLHCLRIMKISYCEGLKQVKVCACNIKTFEYLGMRLVQFMFSEACKIENLLLKTDQGEMDKIFGNLSADLPCLKKLSLLVHSSMVHRMPANPWTFCCVESLDLWICAQDDRSDLVKFVPSLLMSVPKLQKLRVMMPRHPGWEAKESYNLLKHNNLKDVEIGCFVGGKVQIRFAMYLLRSAVALEQMVLDQCSWVYLGYGNWKRGHVPPPSAIARHFILKRLEKAAVSKSAKIIFR